MKFLVDANLPRKLTWFNTADFSFAHDWGDAFPDKAIWDHALKNNLIILTRDSEYFHWMFFDIRHEKLIQLTLILYRKGFLTHEDVKNLKG